MTKEELIYIIFFPPGFQKLQIMFQILVGEKGIIFREPMKSYISFSLSIFTCLGSTYHEKSMILSQYCHIPNI